MCRQRAGSPLLLGPSSLPFARLQTRKTPKTLQLPRGSFHQAPGRQRSSIAACPLPAHSSRQLPPGRQRSSIAACPLPAHCNPGAAKADGQSLVAAGARKQCSSWRVVRVLNVWRGLVAGAAKDLEGFKSFKRLKPGNGRLECLNNRGLWQSRFHTSGPRRRPCLGEGQGRRI